MLTIEIPKSNRRKSEEDALASFILSEIKEKGECVYFHYGVGWGNNWPHCWAKNTGSDAKDRHQISELAHNKQRVHHFQYGNRTGTFSLFYLSTWCCW